MDREYLEDYDQRERDEYEKICKKILEGKFTFGKDEYPPEQRFINLRKPSALTSYETSRGDAVWGQIPFCGSLILLLTPYPSYRFEEACFKKNEVPKLIDFIKETGRLQIALADSPIAFERLEFLEPLFRELNPPVYPPMKYSLFWNEKDLAKAEVTFQTLATIKYDSTLIKEISQTYDSRAASIMWKIDLMTYTYLKLAHYVIVEEVENLIIDNPEKAHIMLEACRSFIVQPMITLRSDIENFTASEIRKSKILPLVYQPQKIRFPCEIGRFLLKKLTYAAQDMGACLELMDHYDPYDLENVQKALNDAIVTNQPDMVIKNTEQFSQILDDIWNDKTIPRRIKNIEIGVPVSIAAVGGIVAGLPGAFAGGFLSELGFKVAEKATEKYAEKLFSMKGEGLTERLAKLRTKSYQANVYDFKKKYKGRINPQ